MWVDAQDLVAPVDGQPQRRARPAAAPPRSAAVTGRARVEAATGPRRGVAQLLLDAQQLVVLGGALAARQRAGLDLAGVDGHGEVGDEGVLRLARAVRDDGAVGRALGQLDGLHRLGQRADLVDLHQHGVGDRLLDALLDDGRVGDEQVVAHQLHACRPAASSAAPSPPSRPRRARPRSRRSDSGRPAPRSASTISSLLQHDVLAAQPVAPALLGELAGGDVEGQRARRRRAGSRRASMASISRSRAAVLEPSAGAKPPSSPTPVLSFLLLRISFSAWKTSTPMRSALREGVGAGRDQHELLEVDAVVGVGAAVDHVHHRHRQQPAPDAAEVRVERQPGVVGRRARHRQRHGQDGVGAERGLVRGAVELQQGLVDGGLLAGLHARRSPARSSPRRCARPAARPCRGSAGRRRRAARPPRACRSRRRRAPPPGPRRPTPAESPPRRWGTRASRGSRDRRHR